MSREFKRQTAEPPTPVAPDAGSSHLVSIGPRQAKQDDSKEEDIRSLRETLAAVQSVLDVTLNNVEQGILMIDADHYVRLYNKKFVDLLEIPRR
ncbi:MAG: PAS-domain containing protein, partial [Hyphomicrobiales bacterium]|nr:PAS-domain containing protein [Hyphomicrobiales bacterium]